jgi:ferredoxin
MTYVVTERCVSCRYTDCAEICPVDCFWKVEEPAMLVIDPIVCIDCSYCVPACPVHAIWLDEEVPAVYRGWIARNVELLAGAVQWSTKEPAMPGALTLEQVQAREKARGWDVPEPGGGTTGKVIEGG